MNPNFSQTERREPHDSTDERISLFCQRLLSVPNIPPPICSKIAAILRNKSLTTTTEIQQKLRCVSCIDPLYGSLDPMFDQHQTTRRKSSTQAITSSLVYPHRSLLHSAENLRALCQLHHLPLPHDSSFARSPSRTENCHLKLPATVQNKSPLVLAWIGLDSVAITKFSLPPTPQHRQAAI